MTSGPAPLPADTLPDVVRSALAASFRLTGGEAVVRVVPTARRGHMSDSARVLVQEADGSRREVFAKWASKRVRIRRIVGYTGAYQREVMFYRELADDCGLRLPRAHFGEFWPETGRFVLLLEYLVTARAGDDLMGSITDVRRVLRTIAKLHARWMAGLPDAAQWLPAWSGPRVRRYARFELDRILRAAARGRLGHAPVRGVLPLLSELRCQLGDFFAGAANARQTLVHGDLRMDQVLFPDDGDVVIVDWQLVQRAGVGVDVARLIALSLSTEERRRYENDLLDTYRAALEESGGPAVGRAELLAEYHRGLVWTALVNASFHLACVDGTQDASGSGVHDVMFARITEAATDHGLPRRR